MANRPVNYMVLINFSLPLGTRLSGYILPYTHSAHASTISYTSQDGSSLPVKHFQYTSWPEEGVPDTGTSIIDLLEQVQKWQRSSGTHPIVVHCSGGAGRTGAFIAISILLERLKTEGVVDVFQTVRKLRLQRPGLVQTVVSSLYGMHAIAMCEFSNYYHTLARISSLELVTPSPPPCTS